MLTLWLLRLLFLGAALRVPVRRRTRAAARPPRRLAWACGARPPRRPLVARRRAPRRRHVPARRRDIARPRRHQRHRDRRPVRLRRARGADLPGSRLVRRGPRQHQRHVRQRGRPSMARPPSASATSSRSARSASAWTGGDRERHRAGPSAGLRVPHVRPRPRPVELGLLAIVAAALLVGGASLGVTERFLKAKAAGEALPAFDFAPPDPAPSGCTSARCSSSMSRSCSPAAGRTRCCCRPSPCSAGSDCC